ncbi:tRNA-uridine aminocarboxypropyltransferase 1 [Anopheles ziemanni]|uniref:tRNA-uridine aminocarboxypropyltransferase 1 n=1 Tax=Anopheles coustani TaxID=139045 RepID=UPI002659914A|nr:tRNA-uridine aminocarboxypropyltransferase 1 [Anopheles coustani]XP_058171555.1 tRNA-uridine aminocarboxypropyltransferase 1 [Anopheles ziemanni]
MAINDPTVRPDPFEGMSIAPTNFLMDVEGRSACPVCGKSRKFFCYTCYVPVAEIQSSVPRIQLPVKVDVIKHKNEIDGKSTAVHAAILAPDDVKIYTYPEIPDYREEEGVVLIFPTPSALTVASLFSGETYQMKENYGLPKGYHMGTLLRFRLNDIVDAHVQQEHQPQQQQEQEDIPEFLPPRDDSFPIKKAIFIDSTWSQCRGIYKDERLHSLRTVVIQNRISQFWRHQRNSPRWFLATVEAIHQFLMEVHIAAWGLDSRYRGLDHIHLNMDQIQKSRIFLPDEKCGNGVRPYNGQYDNILFFFRHMYNLIHKHYDHETLKAYKRPLY